MKSAFSTALVLACFAASHAQAQTLAFPGAEGFGRFASGARTNLSSASVYHVTNLNDSGAGSLRDALSQSNRFVVFDVGGIINLESVVTVASNITIAGQTAPGGITVYSDRVAFHNANNLISRHWAIRKGDPGIRDDAASIARGTNMIFDHMSITWGVDGTFDINPDSGFVIDDITIQNTIIAQGLDRLGHSTGGLMQPGTGGSVSVIKSLWADNVTRNPKVRNDNEFINNVVYGWESAAYIMGDTSGTSNANVMGNYFIEGPVNGSSPFSSGTSSFHIYANDNWVDTDRDGVLDGSLITSYPGADVVASPHAFPTTASLSAQQAVDHVMANAGPHIVRDAVDTRLMQEVASYGTLGGVIDRETDLFPGFGSDPQYLNPRARLTDADNDGIADNWETSRFLNPSNGGDWKNLSGAGYTWLEEYVNELGADGSNLASAGGTWTSPASWGGAMPTLADTATVNGVVSHAGGHAFARRVRVDGSLSVSGGTLDVFDTATHNGTTTISNAVVTAGRVLVASPGQSGSLTVQSGGTLQTGAVASSGGVGSLSFDGGTFRAADAPSISVPTTLNAGGATFDTAGYSGAISGSLSGPGGITKQGEGELAITGPSSFSGPTVIEQGALKVQSSSALQGSSSIEVQRAGVLDVSSIGAGYVAPAGQTVSGSGQVQGSLVTASGSVLRPEIDSQIDDYALGVQAEAMTRSSNWAVFNNNVHGTGAGGSYNGNGLFGSGVILVSGENTSAAQASTLLSTTVDIPESGTWYLFARVAAPSLSVVSGDISTGARGNNSVWVSGNPANLETTPSNFQSFQSLAQDNFDAAVWSRVSPTLASIGGVWDPEAAGIDYNLTEGQQAFVVGGREVGTIVDGFVLSTKNLTAAELDQALTNGSLIFGGASGISISGNLTQQAGSILEIELGSPLETALQVGGTANLAGQLDVTLAAGFTPNPSDVFTILAAGNLINQFSNVANGARLSTSNGTGSFLVDYDYANDAVLLSAFQAGLTGDYNGDGVVDAADYTVWRDGGPLLNETETIGSSTIEDYYAWRSNYGAVANGGVGGGTGGGFLIVPEPTALPLVVLAIGAMGRALRSRETRR